MHIDGIQPQTWLAIFAAVAAMAIALVAIIVLKRRNDKLRFILAELNARQQHHSWDTPALEVSAAVEAAPQPPAGEPAPVEPSRSHDAVPEPAAIAPPVVEPPVVHAAAPEAPAVDPPAVEPLAAAEPVAAPEIVAPLETPAPTDSEPDASTLSSQRAEERAVEFASRQGRRRPPVPPSESLSKLDDTNPKEALSEWLNKRAAARAVRRTAPAHELPAISEPEAAAVVEPIPTEPSHTELAAEPEVAAVAQPIPEPAAVADPIPPPEETAVVEPSTEPAVVADPIPEPEEAVVAEPIPAVEEAVAQPAAEEPKQPTVFIDESLWETILGQSQTVKQPRFELIQGAATALPSGLQDETVLRRLLEANRPFHGLAVALGFSLTNGRALSEDLMLHIEQLVRSLLQDNDFACQTADSEFLLLLPGKRGAEAQSRLSGISERLWDFQLRGAGNFAIMVNLGDALISGEPLSAASVAASARLRQARRARKPVSVASRKSISAVV